MNLRTVTISNFLLEALAVAQEGIRRNQIDEVEELLERCRIFGRSQWPPQVVQFVDGYKRGRGRKFSKRANAERFERDPNRVAAAYATALIAKMRPGGSGPYKIVSGGTKRTVTAEAIRKAVEYVNGNRFYIGRARHERVADLVRRSRGKYPGGI